MKQNPNKIAVAVSGAGRSLLNLLERAHGFEVGAVISSSATAKANEIAKARRLPLYLFDAKDPRPGELETWLLAHGISWVALAGFLKPFPMLPSFADHVINIHPALLPKYGGKGMYGMRVHEAVFERKETHSGPSIHFVNERYDEGSLIAQAEIPLAGAASAADVAARVFTAECELYPEVLSRLVKGELPLSGNRVWHYQIKG